MEKNSCQFVSFEGEGRAGAQRLKVEGRLRFILIIAESSTRVGGHEGQKASTMKKASEVNPGNDIDLGK